MLAIPDQEAWTPLPYQEEVSEVAYQLLKDYAIAYFNWEEQTGKSVSALCTVEKTRKNRCIIVTKKSVIDGVDGKGGWNKVLRKCAGWLTKEYIVVNYEIAHKYIGLGDIIILDEPHVCLSGFPRVGIRQKHIKELCENKPIIFLSATPSAQGRKHLYHQLQCSTWSPWSMYPTAYLWFDRYGERTESGTFYYMRTRGGEWAKDYTRVLNEQAQADIEHLFVHKTRVELGFKQEPVDVLHHIDLDDSTREAYNSVLKDKVLFFKVNGVSYKFLLDSVMKMSTALHMLEGGVIKVKDEYIDLKATEKIDYIKKHWGDSEDTAIMFNYIAEGTKLRKHFKNALILQASRYAEGISLAHIKNLVIYSQDFSTAKHSQRRARQTNINRTEEIKVHFLLVKDAVSAQVYERVSVNKVSFIDSLFQRKTI